MNYQSIYESIVRKFRSIRVEIGENHHIIPKCMNGSNKKENMIRLPPREHFFAHQLLCKIYPKNEKLAHALNMMCVGDIASGHDRTSKRYSWIRTRFILNHPCKSKEVRDKIANTLRNRPKKGPTMIEKLCDCGCGLSLLYQKGNKPTEYIKGHRPKRVWSMEQREKYSTIAKNRIAKLTDDEKDARIQASLLRWQSDPEKEKIRGKKISETKRRNNSNK